MENNMTRRNFLKMLGLSGAGLVLAPLIGKEAVAELCSKEKDAGKTSIAKALKYVDKSPVKGKNCKNCSLYIGPGKCAAIPTCDVVETGYCNSWNKKA